MDSHFVLKCNKCKWHGGIDQACKPNPCPNCRNDNYLSNLVSGTQEELEIFIKGFKQ